MRAAGTAPASASAPTCPHPQAGARGSGEALGPSSVQSLACAALPAPEPAAHCCLPGCCVRPAGHLPGLEPVPARAGTLESLLLPVTVVPRCSRATAAGQGRAGTCSWVWAPLAAVHCAHHCQCLGASWPGPRLLFSAAAPVPPAHHVLFSICFLSSCTMEHARVPKFLMPVPALALYRWIWG